MHRASSYSMYVNYIQYVYKRVLPDKSSRNGWTCRVVRLLPHTKSAHTACKKRSWRWTGEVRNMSS